MTGPAITCLLTAHMKPTLRDSLESIAAQTRTHDLHVLVVDSGRWQDSQDPTAREMAAIHAEWSSHPLVEWTFTGEPANLRLRKCPVGWATNQAIRAGLVRGRYMCTFYDDDRYEPRYMERMAGFLDRTPQAGAVWCSQIMVTLHRSGEEEIVGIRPADGPKYGASFDCQVDGAQVMWRTEVLDRIGDPWLPEEPSSCFHSDGVFLDKLGEAVGIVPPIPEVLCIHRYTPLSTFNQVRP